MMQSPRKTWLTVRNRRALSLVKARQLLGHQYDLQWSQLLGPQGKVPDHSSLTVIR
jgi:hypothetical protein